MPHPYNWEEDQPFPSREILDPPRKVAGLWVGICVFCGGSLGGPYQEDLMHVECLEKAHAKSVQEVQSGTA